MDKVFYRNPEKAWVSDGFTVFLGLDDSIAEVKVFDTALAPRYKGIESTFKKFQQNESRFPPAVGFLLNNVSPSRTGLFVIIYVRVDYRRGEKALYALHELIEINKNYTAGKLSYYENGEFSIEVYDRKDAQECDIFYFKLINGQLKIVSGDNPSGFISILPMPGMDEAVDEDVEVYQGPSSNIEMPVYPERPSFVPIGAQAAPAPSEPEAMAVVKHGAVNFDDADLDQLLKMRDAIEQAIGVRRVQKIISVIHENNHAVSIHVTQLTSLLKVMVWDKPPAEYTKQHSAQVDMLAGTIVSMLPEALMKLVTHH